MDVAVSPKFFFTRMGSGLDMAPDLENKVKLLHMNYMVVIYIWLSPFSSFNLHFTLCIREVLTLPHMYHNYVLLFTCPSQLSFS